MSQEVDQIVDVIRREVAMQIAQRQVKGTLVCTSYDPDKHAIKGMLMPHRVETGWIPIGSHHIGNGFGMLVGPKPGSAEKLDGDQFDIVFDQGDPNTPIAALRLFSAKDKPPRVESGEMLLRHESGNSFLFDKNKEITIRHHKGGTQHWDKDGKVTITTKDQDFTVDAGKGSHTFKAKGHTFDGPVNVRGSVTATEDVTAGQRVAGSLGVLSGGLPVRTA